MAPARQSKPLTPVLIIPGFMSSALTIKKSPHKSWEGKRIWMNITQLGFESLHVGGALRENEKSRASQENKTKGGKPSESSDAMHQQYMKEMECKSRWVHHMCLQNDMKSEKAGIEVRPIPGCAGVDYLSAGALTESISYVFGPVLELLKSKGYKEGINLDAAPYDWRLPPDMLQKRDKYFTNTMETITHLYRQSNNTPVIILCHSLGCKTGHYLFNFVRHHLGEGDGQKWLDKHIHSYVPVGAPHIGAPKSIRAVIDGDKMGLDAFIDEDEGLMFGRSLGSSPWLFPLENTTSAVQNNSPSVPPSVMRLESSITLTIPTQAIPMKSFVYRRAVMPSKIRLAIHLAKDFVIRTDYYPLSKGKAPTLMLKEEIWCVALPPTINESLKLYPNIFVHLEEPGTGKARKERRGIYHCDIFWPYRFACCMIKWIFCLPCAIVLKILRFLGRGADRGLEATAGAVGSVRAIGKSRKVNWGKGLIASSKAASRDGGESGDVGSEIRFQILPTDREGQGFFFEVPSPQECVLKVKWLPPTSLLERKPFHKVSYKSTTIHQYYPATARDLLVTEGLNNATNLLKDSYAADPVDPRGLSSRGPPPIKKVVAIYGINLPTEVSGVYQRKRSVKLTYSSRKDLCVRKLTVLDKDARLTGLDDGYTIKSGIITETKSEAKKSGDGTVPYWSLQHCRAWQGEGVKKCNVKVYEIEGAEHRAVLNDKKFHRILLEVIGCE